MDLSKEDIDKLMRAAEQMDQTTQLVSSMHSALVGDPLKGRVGYLGKVDKNTQGVQDHEIKIDVLHKEVEKVKSPWKSLIAAGGGGATLGAFWEHIVNFIKST